MIPSLPLNPNRKSQPNLSNSIPKSLYSLLLMTTGRSSKGQGGKAVKILKGDGAFERYLSENKSQDATEATVLENFGVWFLNQTSLTLMAKLCCFGSSDYDLVAGRASTSSGKGKNSEGEPSQDVVIHPKVDSEAEVLDENVSK